MAVSISKTQDEIREMPLVELAWEILKAKKEPFYFRDLMNEIQQLRGMSDDEVSEVIARLYTEINIDGRFVCLGHNVWGLKRWYPVDKLAERTVSGKKFVRSSGDAFSDDDEEFVDEYDEDLEQEAELDEGLDDYVAAEDDVEREDGYGLSDDEEGDLYVDDEEDSEASLDDVVDGSAEEPEEEEED